LDIQRNRKRRNSEERSKRDKRELEYKFYIVWMNRNRKEDE
jgi:hypothetical protein